MNERWKHSNKRIWVFAALCALLLLSLAGAAGAIFSAVGLEQTPQCGMAEHRHSESCYLGDVLICGEKAHTHGENCYLLLLGDNDINALLSRVAASEGRSLKSVLQTLLLKKSADMSAIVFPEGEDDEALVPTETPAETPSLTQAAIAAVNAAEAQETPALVLNERLTQPAEGRTESEGALLQDLLIRSGVATLAIGDTPGNADNTVYFYIRLDGKLTYVGSGALTATSSGWLNYYFQISKTDAVSNYTDQLVTNLTSSNIQSNGYYFRYTTSTPTGTASFDSAATAGGSYVRFGSDWYDIADARYAILSSTSGSTTPIDFYTLTLDYTAVSGSTTKRYVESGYAYTLPTLTDAHWEDADGNTITSVTVAATTTVYARPNTCTVTYYVDGMVHAADTQRANTAYTLRALPAGYDFWRSGSAGNYGFYPGGTSMTLNGDLTLAAVRYVTATFQYLDGSVTTQRVLPGQSVTVPSGYWTAGTVSYTGGTTLTIESDLLFTEAEGPPLMVNYNINWATPGGLTAPAVAPSVQDGQTTETVASGTTHTVKNVTERTVVLAFSSVTSRYGAVYFTGWLTETGETIQPDSRIGYGELAQYDANGDGTVALTGQWDYHALKSVNFFVKYNSSYADGNTGADAYTPVVFTTYMGGIDTSLGVDKLNETYAIQITDTGATYYSNDKLIRNIYGTDTTPWFTSFPDDNDMFEALKTYAQSGQLSVPNDAGEFVTVNVTDLNEFGYAIRWYNFKVANDGGSLDDWHVDGLLVRKEGRVHTTKTFSGNETLIVKAKDGFYIHAVNADQSKHYILTVTAADSTEQSRILNALNLSAGNITGWLTPIDDGDGDDNTLLWEFGDVKYNEQWTVTEYPPDVAGSADYAEWIVVDSSALGQTSTGTGGTVTVRGTTYATDLEDPEWLRAEFNNIYFRGNSLMIKKEDAATGQALAGAEFELWQDGVLMTFDYDAETGLYKFDTEGKGAVSRLTCNGYTNLSTEGFTYEKGDITVREVTTPAGYHSIGDVTIGYTEDTDGDGKPDSTVGIRSESGEWARYDQGLLVIRNSSAPVTVSVLKKWNCADSERTDVTVQLLANGSANTAAAILRESGQAATVTLIAVDGWYHKWENLPTVANGETVTWSVRELKIGTESCKSDYAFANWIVSYETTTGLDRVYLTVENTPKRPMLYLDKRDMSGLTAVPGAEFALVAVDDTGTPLAGAATKTAVTDAQGALSFDNLRYNQRYRLTETRTPDGYLGYDEPAYLTLNENGSVTVETHGYVFAGSTAYRIRVLNRATSTLPETGGSGTTGYYAAGVMLLITALCVAIFLKKRRKEGAYG